MCLAPWTELWTDETALSCRGATHKGHEQQPVVELKASLLGPLAGREGAGVKLTCPGVS